jgi:hypothetical protein
MVQFSDSAFQQRLPIREPRYPDSMVGQREEVRFWDVKRICSGGPKSSPEGSAPGSGLQSHKGGSQAVNSAVAGSAVTGRMAGQAKRLPSAFLTWGRGGVAVSAWVASANCFISSAKVRPSALAPTPVTLSVTVIARIYACI